MSQMIRVLLTDGAATGQIYWIQHKGTDIYYGTGLAPETHSSYHRSGEHHRKSPATYEDLGKKLLLADFKNYLSLETVAVPRSFLSYNSKMPEYKPSKKTDCLVMLDTRTMPAQRHVNVMVALVEPGRTDLLAAGRMRLQQTVLMTSVSPWVEVAILYG